MCWPSRSERRQNTAYDSYVYTFRARPVAHPRVVSYSFSKYPKHGVLHRNHYASTYSGGDGSYDDSWGVGPSGHGGGHHGGHHGGFGGAGGFHWGAWGGDGGIGAGGNEGDGGGDGGGGEGGGGDGGGGGGD